MADALSTALLELLPSPEHQGTESFLQQAVKRMAQAVIGAEQEGAIGAKPYERTVSLRCLSQESMATAIGTPQPALLAVEEVMAEAR